MTSPPSSRPGVPLPLTVATSVVGLEALAYGVLGVLEFAAFDPDKPVVAVSTGLFFVALAGFLGFCAWRLRLLHSWARAPIVMTQLIQIPVGFSFWGDGWTRAVTVVLLWASIIALVGVFHPRSLRALEHEE